MVVSGKEIVYQWVACFGKLAEEARWHCEILTIMVRRGVKLSIEVTKLGKRSGVDVCQWASRMVWQVCRGSQLVLRDIDHYGQTWG